MSRAVRGPLLLIVFIALLLAGLWFWVRTSLPELEGEVRLPGLAHPVAITRDDYGVPLIEAESQEDLYYALGYVHAQDRLWQMEYRRLQAAGRLAELLGEEALPSDLLMRTLGLHEAAERELAALSPRTSGVLQAYSDGVNAYLATRTGALPLEFQLLGHAPEEWSPVDVALLQKLVAWRWSSAAADELFAARLLAASERAGLLIGAQRPPPLAGPDAPLRGSLQRLPLARLHDLLVRSSGVFAGSEAWVLGPERSADGVPLLAVEGAGPATAPAPWYLVRLRAPGLNVAGASLPGLPLLFSGRNGEIAWALVPAPVDDADLFIGRTTRGEGREDGYRSAGRYHEFARRREAIEVRGADDVELVVRETVHGPIISDLVPADSEPNGGASEPEGDAEDPFLALSWTALREGDSTLGAGLALAGASDREELRAALASLDELHGFALYADEVGRIGRQRIGRLPARRETGGRLPTPAEAGGWQEWAASARLESSGGGTSLAAAGNLAASSQLIDSLEVHTAASLAHILEKEYLHGSAELLPALRESVPVGAAAASAQAELVGWSGEAAEGAAPLLFSAWLIELGRELLGDELGNELAEEASRYPELLRRALSSRDWCDDRRTDERESCAEVTSKALSAAAGDLAEQHGPQPARWPEHPSAQVAYRHLVLDETLLAPLFVVGQDGRSNRPGIGRGPVFRAVFQLSDETVPEEDDDAARSGFLIPTGQSGNVLSRHYRDLSARWPEVRLLPLFANGAEAGARLLLEPPR
ncbi:MAG TPA: penicillin acylase family protein [Trueperaceae bacterium]